MAAEGAFPPNRLPRPRRWEEMHRVGAEVPNGGVERRGWEEMHRVDRRVVALAARQHGVVSTAQLVAAGIGRRAIARRVERGWLTPLFRGAYQVGPVPAEWSREMAALLACGGAGLLSHHSAAAIWGIHGRATEVHITVVGRDQRTRLNDGGGFCRGLSKKPGIEKQYCHSARGENHSYRTHSILQHQSYLHGTWQFGGLQY